MFRFYWLFTVSVMASLAVSFCFAQSFIPKEEPADPAKPSEPIRDAIQLDTLERKLVLAKLRYGPEHFKTGDSSFELGLLYKNMTQFSKAEPLLKKALEIERLNSHGMPPQNEIRRVTLASLYHSMGKKNEADDLLRQVRIAENKSMLARRCAYKKNAPLEKSEITLELSQTISNDALSQAERKLKELVLDAKQHANDVEIGVLAHDEDATCEGERLLQISKEINTLEAQILSDKEKNTARVRRQFVSGSKANEPRFIAYVRNWIQKIEKVGNLNYPIKARENHIYGAVQITAAIRTDGTIESVEVNRSSGSKILDEAAVIIAKLAAPYEPFTDEIRQDTDVLHITRTWRFVKGDRLGADEVMTASSKPTKVSDVEATSRPSF